MKRISLLVALGIVFAATARVPAALPDNRLAPNLEVEGRITAADDLDVPDLHRRRAELTLRLADGRLLDFLIANEEGAIKSTGRGLHKA